MYRVSSEPGVDAVDHRRVELAARSLRRIAAVLDVSVATFFKPEAQAPIGRLRSRDEQAAALLKAFEQIADPRARERLVALIETKAAIAADPVD